MPYSILGTTQNLGTEPFVLNGKHYVPLREVVEALGGNVNYDNNSKTAVAKIGPWNAHLTMGEQSVTVTGDDGTSTPVNMTAPAYVDGDTFFVPFDFLRDAYGYNVSFEGDTLNIVNPNA